MGFIGETYKSNYFGMCHTATNMTYRFIKHKGFVFIYEVKRDGGKKAKEWNGKEQKTTPQEKAQLIF